MAGILERLSDEGFALPDFANSNLEVTRELSLSTKGRMIGKKDRKVLLIIDGLGYGTLASLIKRSPELVSSAQNLKLTKISTLFPSTTVNVLSSMYSGKTTAEHGVVGTTLFMKYFGTMIDTLHSWGDLEREPRHLSGMDAKMVFPEGQMAAMIEGRGKSFKMHLDENMLKGAITKAAFRQEDLVPHMSFDDMMVKILEEMDSGTDYIFGYTDLIDHAEHEYSPSAEQIPEILKSLLLSINRTLVPALEEFGYDLIVTADHGQITSLQRDTIVIDHTHKMLEFMNMPPWGESRAMFVEVKESRRAEFDRYMNSKFGRIAVTLDSDDAIESGLFGARKVPEEVRYRFGTHLIIPKGHSSLYYMHPGKVLRKYDKMGLHGGLSEEEMHVPLLIC